jgi:hypothetical protein
MGDRHQAGEGATKRLLFLFATGYTVPKEIQMKLVQIGAALMIGPLVVDVNSKHIEVVKYRPVTQPTNPFVETYTATAAAVAIRLPIQGRWDPK